MEITRIIHPVGQGGFYSERLYDYDNDTEIAVIYDCGGNNQEVMKSCINTKWRILNILIRFSRMPIMY